MKQKLLLVPGLFFAKTRDEEFIRINQKDPAGEIYIKYSDIPVFIKELELCLLKQGKDE